MRLLRIVVNWLIALVVVPIIAVVVWPIVMIGAVIHKEPWVSGKHWFWENWE